MEVDYSSAIDLFPGARGVIYEIITTSSDKPYYGKTVDVKKRVSNYHSKFRRKLRDGVQCEGLYAAFKKYGIETFKMNILYTGVPEAILGPFEKLIIEIKGSYRYGYNLTLGGEGALGRIVSDKTREKLAIAVLTAPIPANNTSGYKGVCWSAKKGQWRAQITLAGIKYHLGFFDTIEEAVAARTAALEAYLLRRELPQLRRTSMYKGISLASGRKRPWKAVAFVNGTSRFIGWYFTEAEAVQALTDFYNCSAEDLVRKIAKAHYAAQNIKKNGLKSVLAATPISPTALPSLACFQGINYCANQ